MRQFYTLQQNNLADRQCGKTLPVAAVPMTMPVAVAPAPVTAVPVPVPVMTPTHRFRLEPAGFFGGGDRGMRIRRRQPAAMIKRLRRQRRGLCAGGKRGGSGGKSKGYFQKVAAFHDISLRPWRVMQGRV
jgi:hypothetical protein